MLLTVALLLCALTLTGAAQQPPPRFEVTSVRPSAPNKAGGGFDATPGRFEIENQPLSQVIYFAYDIDRFRLTGPQWIYRERFDIVATGAVTGQTKLMLQALLQDRFGLRAHMEKRPVPVYVLTVLRSDGTLGPNLHRVKVDCSKREPLQDGMIPCSTRNQPTGTLIARATTWGTATLHREMAAAVDRLVIDETGLTGQFDMRLEWSDPISAAEPQSADRPSFITAVREQLGLKLEPGQRPVEVLVIDSVERPMPN
jgi:uncharacterized protein (TIGR03435 family)